MLFLQLFYTYLKIGLFGFGGGYAMLSLIQDEVVDKHGWISTQEFTDIVAISQMTPGPIGINSATYIGYTAVQNAGYSTEISILGSVIATFAVCLPSFILVLIISIKPLLSSHALLVSELYSKPYETGVPFSPRLFCIKSTA
jgi:chromate transporter